MMETKQGFDLNKQAIKPVITSYSIHYTKLYDLLPHLAHLSDLIPRLCPLQPYLLL